MRGLYERLDDISYPIDITILKERIPALSEIDETVVEMLYSDFSNSWYCASWMNLNEDTIADFKRYLFTKDRK